MDRIIEETEDIILLGSDRIFNYIMLGLLLILFGIQWMGLGIQNLRFVDTILMTIFMMVAGFFILLFISELLVNKTVAIDNKSQSITIKKDSKISLFKSATEIPFSQIDCIEIKKNFVPESGDYWEFYIIPILGSSIRFYGTNLENEAERLGKKIGEITFRKIIRSGY